jgi:hypothetical protein
VAAAKDEIVRLEVSYGEDAFAFCPSFSHHHICTHRSQSHSMSVSALWAAVAMALY